MKRKKIFLGILSFIIPFLTLSIIFLVKGFFNNKTILIGDAYSQYYPFYNYLKGIFDGSNSIFYSFNKNLGGSMFGTFFYYLSSPLNIFLIFIKMSNIQLFMTWLIIIKLSLCSLSMYVFMTYKNKTCNMFILVLSVCYGLMGYNLNFFVNIMWLDVVIMTPIVLIGLDKLINKHSPFLYIFSLFISIFSNYYIAYMLCIFCVIYFLYEISLKYDNRKEKLELFKRFMLISLFTGLMCSFFLIPCFAESRNYLRNLSLNTIFSFDYNIFDIFSKSFVGSIDLVDILNYSSMNIYCGVLIIPLVYLYLVNEKISKKERRLTLFVILFLLLPCFIFPLNYVWHLFSKPSFYSYRFSFLLCFFLINIAYKSYINLNINKLKVLFYLATYSFISFYFILIVSFGNYYFFLNYKMIWITLAFLLLYFLILKIKNKSLNKTLICILLLIEILLNSIIVFNNNFVHYFDKKNDPDYITLVEKYKKNRMDFSSVLTGNDSLLMGYSGLNNFVSTNNNKVVRFEVLVGTKMKYSNQNIYYYQDGEYILDSILGIKYIISQDEMVNYKLLEKTIIDNKDIYVYDNPNSLGFGYIIKNECNDIDYDFKYDEKVFNCITGFDSRYYKEYKIENEGNNYKAIIKYPGDFYLVYPGLSSKNININDAILDISKNSIYIKNSRKNYNFEFTIDDEINYDDLKVYYFDFEKFTSKVSQMNKEIMDYKIVNNRIEGTINTNGGILMITLPYEKGYNIKIDGKKVEYKEVLNTFIRIDLEEGYHEITIDYSQPYLKLGVCLSFISLSLIIFYIKKLY